MDKPAELSPSQLYNFHIALKNTAPDGKITLSDFKKQLVTTLKFPLSSADFDAGKKQQPITQLQCMSRSTQKAK